MDHWIISAIILVGIIVISSYRQKHIKEMFIGFPQPPNMNTSPPIHHLQKDDYPTKNYSQLPFWLYQDYWSGITRPAEKIGNCSDYVTDHCLNALDFQTCFNNLYDDCVHQTIYV